MNHHILVKFIPGVDVDKLQPEIQTLFDGTKSIPGVYSVKVSKNCIHRPNRFDLLIKIQMDESALDAYDHSKEHLKWKEDYSHLLEKKAIYDEED